MNRYMIPAVICVDARSIAHALRQFEAVATEGGEGYEIDPKSGMVVWLDAETLDKIERGVIKGETLRVD